VAALPGGVLFAQEGKSLEPKDGLVCLLVNRNSGRCLSVAKQGVESGARIVQGPTPLQAGASEHWRLLEAGKAFRLRNENSGLVLQIWSSNLQPGVQAVQSADQVTKEHQHWTFEPLGDAYLLRAGHSHLVLGVAQSALEEGARVIQWNHVPDVQDQMWILRSTQDVADAVDGAPPATENGNTGWRRWQVFVLLLGLAVALTLAVVLSVWVYRQQQRQARP
jgi:hypothetical protein